MRKFLNFFSREEGAVTVDWVVLTAGVVGLGVGVITILGDGPVNIGNTVSSTLVNDVDVIPN